MDYSALFVMQLRACGLPLGQREYKFHATRKWRFDLAFTPGKIAFEIDGGAWVNGRHNRGSGFLRDMEKMNAAALLGWRVFHVTPDMVKDGTALQLAERVLLCEKDGEPGQEEAERDA